MKAIDIEEAKKILCHSQGCEEPFCEAENGHGVCYEMERFLKHIENDAVTVEAIPVSYIMDRIRDTCGAEATYLGRLVTRYREGRYKDELGNS